MSRSGYVDEISDQWRHIRWRGAVNSAIKGKRGQSFLQELADALDELPQRRLIAGDLERDGDVCAIGALGLKRNVLMYSINPEDSDLVADSFGVARALVCEIEYINDEWYASETPEQRWKRMREWVGEQIKP